jgi:hypothetical protein
LNVVGKGSRIEDVSYRTEIGEFSGHDNELNILGGASCQFSQVNIGNHGNHNSLMVSGIDSQLVTKGTMSLGTNGGRGNKLVVANCARMTSLQGVFVTTGEGPGDENFIEITGAGSKWTASRGVFVHGNKDSGIRITKGAAFNLESADSDLVLGNVPGESDFTAQAYSLLKTGRSNYRPTCGST